ncbi:MAG: ABC transporter ATP-binding protein [Ferruginibacter sp.]
MKRLYVLKRLWSYIAKYKLRVFLLAFLGLFGVLFEVAKPFPIKMVIDNVLSDQPLPAMVKLFFNSSWLASKSQLLISLIGLLVLIVVGSTITTLILFKYTISLAQRLVYDLTIDFFSKLQRLSLSFYTKNLVGDLLQRMSGDVFVVYFLVAQIILPAVASLICLGAMFYIMASIDPVLALVAFSVVPALAVLLAFFVKPMNDTTQVQYKTQGLFSAFVQQSLSSMKVIQAFGRESFMQQKLKAHALEFSQAFVVANKVSMTYNQLTVLITGLVSAVLLSMGAYRSMHGLLTAGDLIIFLLYLPALYSPVNSLTSAIGGAIVISARGKRVFDILDSDEIVKEATDAIDLTTPKGAIEFQNVSFGYHNPDGIDKQILNNISFKVEPGQVIAIVGPTGTGKTSLISLLCRFYDPWKGKVLVDGMDIAGLKLHSLRENISLVLQEPFLFPMTIGENIAFGNPDASFEEITEAAKAAQIHEFILRLPNGYDTKLSEAGSSLSGGERQRISIARAFLKKAPILILDEPTSAVDAHTEAKIFQALNKFSKGKTVFLISHRLSTIKHADQIITIQNGTIVEMGTHDALIEKNSLYADLYKYHHFN